MTMEEFQKRVAGWMRETFTLELIESIKERNHRFLEESLELVQSLDCTETEAHMIVAYVFGRPKGEVKQELGGVLVTLSAMCNALVIDDMLSYGQIELRRCWQNIETIRDKQADKPKFTRAAQSEERKVMITHIPPLSGPNVRAWIDEEEQEVRIADNETRIRLNENSVRELADWLNKLCASYLSRMRERYDPEDKAAQARIPSPIDLIYQQENRRSLFDISSSLHHLHTKVNKIMATQQALADALTTANNKLVVLGNTLDKIGGETSGLVSGTTTLQAQVATLTDELANLETTPAVDAAMAAVQATTDSLTAKAKTVDDLVPDTPAINQDPPGTTAGTTTVDPAINPQSPDIPK